MGHRLARRRQLRLEDLSRDPWVTTLGTDTEVSVLERAAASAGFRPQVRCRSDHYEVLLGLVRAGVGVALVPALGLRRHRDVVVRPLAQERLHREIGVATRPGNPNPLVQHFIEHLIGAADQVTTAYGDDWSGSEQAASALTVAPQRRTSATARVSSPAGNVETTA
jgi:DNA-binding transcriptional LysR family regulator